MPSEIPMSIAFLCAAGEAQVGVDKVQRFRRHFPDTELGVPQLIRIRQPSRWTIRLAQVADGRALVRAGTQIGFGYEVYLPNPDAPGFLDTPRIVASIDRTARAGKNEWLITWLGWRAGAPADAPLVQAQLAPERFAERLLYWIHAQAGSGNVPVDLAGFAESDVPLASVIALADHLADGELVTVDSCGQTAAATLTALGGSAAEQAAVDRGNRQLRARALQRGMITWLADRENAADTPHDWQDFWYDTRATFRGDVFTGEELAREARSLVDRRQIRGRADRNGADTGLRMPQLTAKGRKRDEKYRSDAHSRKNPPTLIVIKKLKATVKHARAPVVIGSSDVTVNTTTTAVGLAVEAAKQQLPLE